MTKCIEENTERLDLLTKTLLVEERQKKRLQELSMKEQKESEEANRRQLFEGTNPNTPPSILDQEEANRKELMTEMIRHSSPSDGPAIKVLNNIQGIYKGFNYINF